MEVGRRCDGSVRYCHRQCKRSLEPRSVGDDTHRSSSVRIDSPAAVFVDLLRSERLVHDPTLLISNETVQVVNAQRVFSKPRFPRDYSIVLKGQLTSPGQFLAVVTPDGSRLFALELSDSHLAIRYDETKRIVFDDVHLEAQFQIGIGFEAGRIKLHSGGCSDSDAFVSQTSTRYATDSPRGIRPNLREGARLVVGSTSSGQSVKEGDKYRRLGDLATLKSFGFNRENCVRRFSSFTTRSKLSFTAATRILRAPRFGRKASSRFTFFFI